MSNTLSAPVSRVSWTASGLPSGCSIDSASGVISGVPGAAGDYTVGLSVETNWGTATGSVVIYVKAGATKYTVRRDGSDLTQVTLPTLKQMLADRTFEETFQIGDQLILPWKDPSNNTEYECPMNFGTLKNFTLEDDSLAYGLGLQAQYALPASGAISFDTKEPNNADSNRRTYGNNRWSVSNIRQWLNATGSSWYSAQHETDAKPSYSGYTGFKDTFPSEFVDVLTPVKNVTKVSSVDGGGLDVTLDTFFLLSTHEVFSNPSSDDALSDDTEGAYWQLWKIKTGLEDFQTGQWTSNAQGAYNHYKIENHSSATSMWLRNCYGNLSWKVWNISDTGYFPATYPTSDGRVTPACAICAA